MHNIHVFWLKYKKTMSFWKGFYMHITDIRIRRTFEEGPLKAVASITIENILAIHDVKVVFARDHYFVVMPSRKNPDGTYRDIVHPITADFRQTMEQMVIEAYHAHLALQAEEGVPSGEPELATY